MKTRQITITVTAPGDVDVNQVLMDYIHGGIEIDRSREDDGDEEAIRRLAITWEKID